MVSLRAIPGAHDLIMADSRPIEATYSFLATFSGTQFVTPRAVRFQADVTF